MTKYFKTKKPCPTDLTWEERNPSSYLFDVEILAKLQRTIEKARKEEKKGVPYKAVRKKSRS